MLACAAVVMTAAILCASEDQPAVSISTAVNVRNEHLLVSPVAADWPSYNGDYTGRRYSALHEITAANVAQLRAQWVFHAPNSNRLEVTPVVVGRLMFVTAANDAFALDAQTGERCGTTRGRSPKG